MTREVEPRPEPSNAPAERACSVCRNHPVASRHAIYVDEASHVVTDTHLEAMAVETVREWLARDPFDAVSVGIAKQIARMERFYGDYRAWRMSMGLPDTPETLLINRRIAAVWIESIGQPFTEERLAYARKVIELENTTQKEARHGDT